MTATNVTPVTPVALPYTYTQNYGQAYEFASLSKQGCVDTVYADTYNGSAYVPGLPVSAAESIQLIQDANQQFGPVFQACQSLVNQLPSASTTTSSTFMNLDFFPQLGTGNWLIDDSALVVVVLAIVGGGMRLLKWIESA